MKKFINIMLALALTTRVATITLAQDTTKEDKKKKVVKKGGADSTMKKNGLKGKNSKRLKGTGKDLPSDPKAK